MKKGNRPITLAYSENFFNLQKGTKENNTQSLRKKLQQQQKPHGCCPSATNMVSMKHSLDAAGMEESPKFLRAGPLFVCCCCLGHVQAMPSSPVVRSKALQLSVCTTGLRVSPRTHVTEGRLENSLSTCNQHQRRQQYLGIPHVLPRTGVLALTTGLSAEAGR